MSDKEKKGMWLVPAGIRKIIKRSTRAGRVSEIKKLNQNLQNNTDLVAKEYVNLELIEKNVAVVYNQLEGESFEDEMIAIDDLAHIDEKERKKFKGTLVEIKQRGLEELEPIVHMAQKIKAHMLITLNKANIQKSILQSKTDLAQNAHLQVETLSTINEETKDISKDLKKLMDELDDLNTTAINDYSKFVQDAKNAVSDKEDDEHSVKSGADIIEKIMTRGTDLKNVSDKLKVAKKESES